MNTVHKALLQGANAPLWILILLLAGSVAAGAIQDPGGTEPDESTEEEGYREDQVTGLNKSASKIFFSDRPWTFSLWGEFNGGTEIDGERNRSSGDIELFYESLGRLVGYLGFRLAPLHIGYINNNDEPVLFYSVNRPTTERLIIPTEWIEFGFHLSSVAAGLQDFPFFRNDLKILTIGANFFANEDFVFKIDYQIQKNLAATDPELADVDLLEFGIGFAY